MGVIIFDGVSSQSVGVTVEGYSSAPIPERDVDYITVPGRSGNLIVDNGAFLGYNQKYNMFWKRSSENRRAVVGWLTNDGYVRFEDENDPDHFRMAHFSGGIEIDNRMDVLDRASVEFHFKPQRFLTSGETYIFYFSGADETMPPITIFNPTSNKALPIIRVYGNGKLTFDCGATITVAGNTSDYCVEIDCETLNCTLGNTSANANNLVTFSGDPFLAAGNNTINVGSGITDIDIKPRWWEL